MNDPGLHEPISNADSQAQTVYRRTKGSPDKNKSPNETQGRDLEKNIEQNEVKHREEDAEPFTLPAVWWYTSTAFPLMAGTFGPMANAFSINALVAVWRVEVPEGGSEEHGIEIEDPPWLIAINAVSLAFALTANLFLLLNMARKVSFAIAQPITIVGFWLASVLLIALISVASHSFRAPGVQHQALTQAYYYATFAAGLYQIISYLMCATVWGAYRGAYSKEFQLTMAQRTLMLQTISYLVYQELGALVFSHVEGWNFADAVYWADFTSLTIGIGADYVPTTHLGRGLLFPFAIGGIIILGLTVGSIRSLVLERGKKKMSARMMERTRMRVVKQVGTTSGNHHQPRHHHRHHQAALGLSQETMQQLSRNPTETKVDELRRRQTEFRAMRQIQRAAARERKYFALLLSTLAAAGLWTIGALVFWQTEKNQKWTYFQSLYFAYTSLLTIGYGDLQVMSNSGKPFFVFWSLLAIPTLTILISNMGDTVVKIIKDLTIWLGEVTVLPNTESGALERLKYGLYKATLGQTRVKIGGRGEGKAKSDDEDSQPEDFRMMYPGLARMFGLSDEREEPRERSREAESEGDRLGKDFEDSERLDEELAQQKGDSQDADAHHYRRTLISALRRVYEDSLAPTPKEYSYEEWAFFLKLLGEDESDSSSHRRPEKREPGAHGRDPSGLDQESTKPENGHLQPQPWSWIGSRSPLLKNKDEPQWLLEKMFEKLEDIIHNASQQKDGHSNPHPTETEPTR